MVEVAERRVHLDMAVSFVVMVENSNVLVVHIGSTLGRHYWTLSERYNLVTAPPAVLRLSMERVG